MLCGVSLLYTVWTEVDFVPGVAEAAFLGLLQGLLFLCVNMFRFRARDVFPQHIVLPITKASILLVIVSSWLLFDELRGVTTAQLGGFILIGLSIYLFRKGEVGKATGEPGVQVGVSHLRFRSGAVSLGALFLFLAWRLFRTQSMRAARHLYLYSLLYLTLLFTFVMVDSAVRL